MLNILGFSPISESDDIVLHLVNRIRLIRVESQRESNRTDCPPDSDYLLGLALVREQFERTVQDIRLLRSEVERLTAALQLAYKDHARILELLEAELARSQ